MLPPAAVPPPLPAPPAEDRRWNLGILLCCLPNPPRLPLPLPPVAPPPPCTRSLISFQRLAPSFLSRTSRSSSAARSSAGSTPDQRAKARRTVPGRLDRRGGSGLTRPPPMSLPLPPPPPLPAVPRRRDGCDEKDDEKEDEDDDGDVNEENGDVCLRFAAPPPPPPPPPDGDGVKKLSLACLLLL
jgi:hypothetical protein